MNGKHRRALRWLRALSEPLGYAAVYTRRSGHHKVFDPAGRFVTALSSTPRNPSVPERKGEPSVRRHHKQTRGNGDA